MIFDDLYTGEISSAHGDFVAIRYTDEHDVVCSVEAKAEGFSRINPDGSSRGDWVQEFQPEYKRGMSVVFELDDDSTIVVGWTSEEHYIRVMRSVYSDDLRIIDHNGTQLWEGRVDRRNNDVLSESGLLPPEFGSSMKVETYTPDDIGDTAYDTSYYVPGFWSVVENQEETWMKLVKGRRVGV